MQKIYEEIKRESGRNLEKERKRVRREVKMDKCPTVELGVFTTHLKKEREKEEQDSPCSPKAKIKRGGEIAI